MGPTARYPEAMGVDHGPGKSERPIMGQLEAELTRYETLLKQYEAIAEPFLLQHDQVPGGYPEEVAANQLHVHVIALGQLNNRLADLNSRLRP